MSAISALTTEFSAPVQQGEYIALPLAAATVIYAGALVATNSAGNALPAADTAGLRVWGRAEQTVDNSAGSAGDATVTVRRTVLRYLNSTDNPVLAAHIGKRCYVEADSAVAAASTNHVSAGLVVALETGYVWVDTTRANLVPAAANTITAAADLAALKTALDTLLRANGFII